MLEIFFFLSLLMSWDGSELLGQFSIATMTMEECQEIREEFIDEVVGPSEEETGGRALTTECFEISGASKGIEI